ncbi:MAG: hypothetical protein HKN06_09520 [Gammaproteobacteria bacterium]|nr:hypothetical protein [Gammaproteobacteria bacterium]
MSKLDDLARWQQAALVVVVLAVLSVILVLLAEGAVRVRHYVKHGDMWGVEDTFTKDSDSGLRVPLPSIDRGGIRTNSLGFRSPELSNPKPPGVLRIAFLGGSTTYGAEVSSNEANWPHLVIQQLQQRWPQVRFEYINAGVPGYAAETSLKNLRARVQQLEPDAVVIYHATNDLSLYSYEEAVRQGVARERTEDGLSWLSEYSLLSYLVEKNLRVRTQQAQASDAEPKLTVDTAALAAPFEAALVELGTAAGQVADFVALVTFSTHLRPDQTDKQQAAAAVTGLYYMPYMTITGLLQGFATYNETIRTVAQRLDLHLVDGENDIPGDPVHFADSVHFTDAGSKVMARRVAESLIGAPGFNELVTKKQAE